MADQIKYEQQRFQKLKQHIEREEEEINHRPSINKNSAKMVQKKQGENGSVAHERLYNTAKEGNTKSLRTSESEEMSFVPQINKKSQMMQREGKIEEILLNDA